MISEPSVLVVLLMHMTPGEEMIDTAGTGDKDDCLLHGGSVVKSLSSLALQEARC